MSTKAKKYYVQFQGTKAIEDAIIQLGGAPYDETKKVQQGLLGTMYTSPRLVHTCRSQYAFDIFAHTGGVCANSECRRRAPHQVMQRRKVQRAFTELVNPWR
jgi:hypothetical protein